MSIWPMVAASSFLTAAGAVPLARRWALRGGLLDMPNERSSHTIPKPRVGGVGIVLGSAAGCLTCLLAGGGPFDAKTLVLLAVLLCFSVVGLYDDVSSLSVKGRMPLYLLGAFLLAYFVSPIQSIALPFAEPWALGTGLALTFTTLFITWYANLFNFMDGTDGIAGGAAVVTTSALAVLFAQHEDPALLHISLSIAGASLGFLLFNFAPASVFMGDVGSVFLGAGCGALTAAAISRGYVSLVSGVFFLFPFVFDATFTLLRRALRGEKVWLPHRSHLYQLLCAQGVSHRDVSILYTTAAVACASVGLQYDSLPLAVQAMTLLGVPAASSGIALLVLGRSAKSLA